MNNIPEIPKGLKVIQDLDDIINQENLIFKFNNIKMETNGNLIDLFIKNEKTMKKIFEYLYGQDMKLRHISCQILLSPLSIKYIQPLIISTYLKEFFSFLELKEIHHGYLILLKNLYNSYPKEIIEYLDKKQLKKMISFIYLDEIRDFMISILQEKNEIYDETFELLFNLEYSDYSAFILSSINIQKDYYIKIINYLKDSKDPLISENCFIVLSSHLEEYLNIIIDHLDLFISFLEKDLSLKSLCSYHLIISLLSFNIDDILIKHKFIELSIDLFFSHPNFTFYHLLFLKLFESLKDMKDLYSYFLDHHLKDYFIQKLNNHSSKLDNIHAFSNLILNFI